MTGEPKSGIQCVDFDALLTEALDGLLEGERLAGFERHKAECPACAVLFQEAQQGFDWLHALEEAEPPVHLVHNILAATTGADERAEAAQRQAGKSLWARVKEKVTPRLAPIMSPRFAMSFGMAFFSITMLLSVSGMKLSDLRSIDLSPKGIRRTYYETESRALRYYENIRLVYEIESRVRQLKRATAAPEDKKQEQKPSDRGEGPERRQQNYSRQEREQIMALLERVRLNDRA